MDAWLKREENEYDIMIEEEEDGVQILNKKLY